MHRPRILQLHLIQKTHPEDIGIGSGRRFFAFKGTIPPQRQVVGQEIALFKNHRAPSVKDLHACHLLHVGHIGVKYEAVVAPVLVGRESIGNVYGPDLVDLNPDGIRCRAA